MDVVDRDPCVLGAHVRRGQLHLADRHRVRLALGHHGDDRPGIDMNGTEYMKKNEANRRNCVRVRKEEKRTNERIKKEEVKNSRQRIKKEEVKNSRRMHVAAAA